MKSPPLCLEFSRNTLKIYHENDGAELPLERAPDGRLTAAGRDRLATALKHLLKTKGWPVHAPAFCAIDARGVSLRCLRLPAVAGNGLLSVVRLQIESEFPLSPDELAWGCRLLGEPQRQPDGTLKQAVLVAAVKKEIVADYFAVLTASGLTPAFTLAALARPALCPFPPPAYAVLELGTDQCELTGLDGDTAAFVRILPGVGLADPAALDTLARSVRSLWRGRKLYIFGSEETTASLARRLTDEMPCEPLKFAAGPGRTPALLGLEIIAEKTGGLPLTLQLAPAAGPKKSVQPALVEWGVRAALLLLAVLLFPSLEALLLSAPLAKIVETFNAQAGLLETNVDQELNFLQNLKQNQPLYLESFYEISKSAPPGIHLDSITMNRRGEVALRGTLQNGNQVADFRAKLIGSGFFASVTVAEQTPTPDHQKVNVRMTAQWQPMARLQALAIGPTPAELSATNADASGAPPGHSPGAIQSPGGNH